MYNVASLLRIVIAMLIAFNLVSNTAFAQVSASVADGGGTLTITVVDALAHPVTGAAATLRGATTKRGISDATGKVVFQKLLPGLYSLSVSKSGFAEATDANIAITDAQAVSASVALQASSFDTIAEIGRTSTASGSRVVLNTSTAAVSTISASQITDQGQTQVTQVLNQTPGISTQTSTGRVANPGNQAAIPTLRAAAPYETSVLIDGHPVATGTFGSYNLAFLVPYVLQDIEVVKGPGAAVPVINNAIGGSINFRTLDPTEKRQESVDYGRDSELGSFINLKATGTLGRLGYAFDYDSTGSPGPYRNFETPVSPIFVGTINGAPIAKAPYTTAPLNPAFQASSKDISTLAACCIPVNSDYFIRADLAKLRYNIGQQTTVTVSYLGGQTNNNYIGGTLGIYPNVFQPAAGYTGSGGPYQIGVNTNIIGGGASGNQSGQFSNEYQFDYASLFQGEVASAIGSVTLLARYYSGYNGYGITENPTPFNVNFYGSAYIGTGAGTLTYFNGTPATFLGGSPSSSQATDKFGGYSAEADLPAGLNAYTVSFDNVDASSYAYSGASPAKYTYTIPPGSTQQEQTVRARVDFGFVPRVKISLSDYLLTYTDRSTVNSGVTFNTYTHSFNGVRLGTSWQPTSDLSFRLGVGSSIAPPYLSLVTSNTKVPVANTNGSPTFFTQSANAPDLKPETGFGYDLGVDKRIGQATLVSVDAYLTHLENQFLTSQVQSGYYTGSAIPGGPVFTLPLYLTTAQNLGNSIYEGLEFAIKRTPVKGFGYTLQGALQRGYAYNLPAGFYNSTAGPYTTNLAILPYVNFNGASGGSNGLAFSRIPYFQGYAELNYRAGNLSYRVGLTNFGNNNAYNYPAFDVLSASVGLKLTSRLSAILAGDNLNAQHANGYLNFNDGGVPTPLANGLLGYDPARQYGPEIVRLTLTYKTGSH